MARFKTRTPDDLVLFQNSLRYEAVAGKLFWRSSGKEIRVGTKGRICIFGHRTLASRIVWALASGSWPNGNVYAADNDETNIRLTNLRLRDESRYVAPGSQVTNGRTRYAYGLWNRYKLTRPEYEAIAAKQHDCCALCHNPEFAKTVTGAIKMLHVDHNHETGAVRELLCSACNSMIGFAREDEALLRAGAEYLKKHRRSKLTVVSGSEN